MNLFIIVHRIYSLQFNTNFFYPSRVAESSTVPTCLGWGRGRACSPVRWQVTLCDPIWQVMLCSCEVGSHKKIYC